MRAPFSLGVVLAISLAAGCGARDRPSTSASTTPASSSLPPSPPAASPAAPPSTSAPVPVPRGRVSRTTATAAQGATPAITFSYELYVPASYDPATPAPVVIAALMGLSPWEALAEQHGLLVVDFRDYDGNGGYDFGLDVLRLDAIVQDLLAAYTVDARRLHYHGFSAGAHWGYAVALANPGVFAGLGIHAGSLGVALQQGLVSSAAPFKLPVAIRHGSVDQVVPLAEGRLARDRLRAAGHPVHYAELAGVGHAAPSAADAAWIWDALRAARAP